jgi:SAM-dependent methyltransferase
VSSSPKYLEPYVDAAARFGGGFGSLLWANRDTQAARFDAICRLENLHGKSVLDVGCGRADLLEYCAERNIHIADYVGIEAVPALAKSARDQPHINSKIIIADFVEQPATMFVAADVVIISGALNTLDTATFYSTIRRAFDAAAEALVLNFLDSPTLAAATFLTWHARQDVQQFARSLCDDVRMLHDYLDGDSTVALRKEHS